MSHSLTGSMIILEWFVAKNLASSKKFLFHFDPAMICQTFYQIMRGFVVMSQSLHANETSICWTPKDFFRWITTTCNMQRTWKLNGREGDFEFNRAAVVIPRWSSWWCPGPHVVKDNFFSFQRSFFGRVVVLRGKARRSFQVVVE